MSSITNRFQNSVQRNIQRYGKVRQYQRISSSSNLYDVETGTVANFNYPPLSIKMFRSDLTSRDSKTPNMVDKEVQVFLIANADIDNDIISFKPDRGDLIIDGDDSYYVDVINAKDAGNKTAQWRLICYKQ